MKINIITHIKKKYLCSIEYRNYKLLCLLCYNTNLKFKLCYFYREESSFYFKIEKNIIILIY